MLQHSQTVHLSGSSQPAPAQEDESGASPPWPAGLEAVLGGRSDSRAALHPRTGLNRYGCAPRPRPGVLPLGSCTASSVAPGAVPELVRRWNAYEAARAHGGGEAFIAAACTEIQAILAKAAGRQAPAGIRVVLTPSGTDAELLAAWLVRPPAPGRLCNVVVGPDEAGSGTLLAAAGRYFDPITPLGGGCAPGSEVPGADPVAVVGVPVRRADGRPRTRAEVEAELDAILAEAVARGDRVLLHVLVHSKTGLHQPGLAAVSVWRARHGAALRVVADAAQGRLSRGDLAALLAMGAIVMVSGSKFFGGPPFSGALLVPPGAEVTPHERLPSGFSDFVSRADLPVEWAACGAGLREAVNPSLAFRWLAAIATWKAHEAVPSSVRRTIRREFGRAVHAAFSGSNVLSLEALPAELSSLDGRPADPTVFSFTVNGTGGPLGVAALAELHRALASASPGFHLGQPVRLGARGGREHAVLRIALGAALIHAIATDRTWGATLPDRLDLLGARLHALRVDLEALAAAARAA